MFDYLIKFANLKLIYKCLNNQAPKVLSDLVGPLRVFGSVS